MFLTLPLSLNPVMRKRHLFYHSELSSTQPTCPGASHCFPGQHPGHFAVLWYDIESYLSVVRSNNLHAVTHALHLAGQD
jgi:hypothetical protein